MKLSEFIRQLQDIDIEDKELFFEVEGVNAAGDDQTFPLSVKSITTLEDTTTVLLEDI